MHILFLNRYFHPDVCSTAQLLTDLTEDLAGQGDRVTVIAGRSAYAGDGTLLPARDLHKGVEILRVRTTNLRRRSNLGRLVDSLSFHAAAFCRALRLKQIDCVVALADPPLLHVVATLLQLCKGCRTVCWSHDVFPEVALRARVLPDGIVARWLQRIAGWSLCAMDRVVAIGRCMAQRYSAAGLERSQVVHILNWADGDLIRPIEPTDNPFLDWHHLRGRFVVMHSGNFGIVHEYNTIEALMREARCLAPLHFCVIGGGCHVGRLADLARKEQWSHATFLDYQPREVLRFSLSAAHVHLVLLREEMEGLCVPSKLYGAMAAGRPVIFVGPSGSEAADMIRRAECGYVVRRGNHQALIEILQELQRNPERLATLGRNARRYFEAHCTRSLATSRFRTLIHDLVGCPISQAPPVMPLRPSHARQLEIE